MKKFKNVLKKIKCLCDGLVGNAYAFHNIIGANISFAVTLFIGVSCSCNPLQFVAVSLAGFLVACIAAVFKEYVIDDTVDNLDIVNTCVGGSVPVILSLMCYLISLI